jgi:hypothetical protein
MTSFGTSERRDVIFSRIRPDAIHGPKPYSYTTTMSQVAHHQVVDPDQTKWEKNRQLGKKGTFRETEGKPGHQKWLCNKCIRGHAVYQSDSFQGLLYRPRKVQNHLQTHSRKRFIVNIRLVLLVDGLSDCPEGHQPEERARDP